MKKVHIKKVYIVFIIYNFVLLISFFISMKCSFIDGIQRYLLFDTQKILFKDLLSIGITILAIIIGAIITAATILMSMCNTRLMKLINRYGKSKYIIGSIKESIITGISSVCLYAIIYSNLDFVILWLRVIILYVASWLLILFVIRSKLLIKLVISLLNSSFTENDSIVSEAEFLNPKHNKQ